VREPRIEIATVRQAAAKLLPTARGSEKAEIARTTFRRDERAYECGLVLQLCHRDAGLRQRQRFVRRRSAPHASDEPGGAGSRPPSVSAACPELRPSVVRRVSSASLSALHTSLTTSVAHDVVVQPRTPRTATSPCARRRTSDRRPKASQSVELARAAGIVGSAVVGLSAAAASPCETRSFATPSRPLGNQREVPVAV